MLVELAIKNFAIIPQLRLSFHGGMTALTGETGAGKSIIIDAVGLLCGGRGSVDYIREGADKCQLEGLFEIPPTADFLALLTELGIETEEDALLILQRDMTKGGKNICRVNGRTMTLANLRRIGSFLVDIQGQNEHQELLQPERHLHLLDSFAGESFQQQLKEYQEHYRAYRTQERQVSKIKANEQSFVQRLDMLQFQVQEISEARLQPEEEAQLLEERAKLGNYQRIVDALQASYQVLTETDGNALDGVGLALQSMQGIADYDQEYQEITENIQSAFYLLQDVTGDLSRQMDSLAFDEERLEEVNQRLELIHQLKRKYGESVPAILAYYEAISQELAEASYGEGHLEKMTQELTVLREQVWQEAAVLHEIRRQNAQQLAKAIVFELKDLYMEHSQFEVRFTSGKKEIHEFGYDEVEFYLTTNPGEPLKPLVKVASGGELSRILLALKTIFSQNQGITSIIFDEVDTGVSGRVAQAIAEKIAKIAENSQVLCITHLPQVAARADYQYHIAKQIREGRTETTVKELSAKARIQEVARMLSGAAITDLTVKHAKELLDLAHQNK